MEEKCNQANNRNVIKQKKKSIKYEPPNKMAGISLN